VSNAGDASPVLVARVVPNVTGLDKQFDYLVPTAARDRIAVGSLVRVPLHGRRVGGWVVGLGPPSGDVAVEKLLPIAKWSSVGPCAELIELAEWAGERWGAARLRPFLVAADPPTMGALPRQRRTVAAEPAGEVAGGVRWIAAHRPAADGGWCVPGPSIVIHPAPAARAVAAGCARPG
jgi:primosomal protein N' (replication factor Y)